MKFIDDFKGKVKEQVDAFWENQKKEKEIRAEAKEVENTEYWKAKRKNEIAKAKKRAIDKAKGKPATPVNAKGFIDELIGAERVKKTTKGDNNGSWII